MARNQCCIAEYVDCDQPTVGAALLMMAEYSCTVYMAASQCELNCAVICMT